MDVPRPQCLVLVDLQRGFLRGAAAVPEAERLVAAATSQLSCARRVEALVVHLQNNGDPGSPDELGTDGWELALPVRAADLVLQKLEDDGFAGTDLHDHLRRRGITSVSISGLMSEMCVAATARSALRLGYEVVLAHDSHATYPIPAFSAAESPVSALSAARAAEWSLGDGVSIPATGAEVRFARPPDVVAGSR